MREVKLGSSPAVRRPNLICEMQLAGAGEFWMACLMALAIGSLNTEGPVL